MPRITRIHFLLSTLLLFSYATSSFSGVKGWCVESGKVNILTHVEMLSCHAGSVSGDSSPCDTRPSHVPAKHPCTACFDIKPDTLAIKLVDDGAGSLVAPPASAPILLADQYSGLKIFATASPRQATAAAPASLLQSQRNKTLGTVVLLI